MRIRTQFILTMILFGVVLAGISITAMTTSQRVERVSEQDRIAHRVAQGASELSYLANDYVMYREGQQLDRWQSRFARFSADVAGLRSDRPEQQTLVRNIQANTQGLEDVFASIASTVEHSVQDHDGTTTLEFLQVSWSRVAVQSQALVSDASRLSQLLGDQVDRLQRRDTIVLFALIGGFVAYFLANYLLIQRRMLESIAELQAGTAIIGSGDLEFRIEEKRNDEIGDLSRAFNQMTADLKTATAALLQSERLSIAGRLAASVAHEINNPLQAVLGCLGLAQGTLQDGKDPGRYLQIAHQEVQRTARIVGQLRSLGRPIQDAQRESTELNHLLGDVLVLNKKHLQNHAVEVIWEPDSTLPAVAVAPDAMRQVFLNLVLNAVDAMPEGGQLRLSTACTESPAGVRIVVADNGTGIPPEALPHIFEAFYTTKAEGMGVGLYLCQRIVQEHGGRIEVVSTTSSPLARDGGGPPCPGTTFTIWLPSEV